jgi:hypothetical protein
MRHNPVLTLLFAPVIVGGSRVAEAHAGIDYAAGKGPRRSAHAGHGTFDVARQWCEMADQAEATVGNKSRRYSFVDAIEQSGRYLNLPALTALRLTKRTTLWRRGVTPKRR